MNVARGWLGRLIYRLGWPVWRRILSGSRRVRMVVLNRRGGEVLLVKNTIGRQLWTLPGGGVKPGEDLKAAACRELEEETGITLDPKQLRELYDEPFYRDTPGLQWHLSIYLAEIERRPQQLKKQPELLDSRWFSSGELPGDLTEAARLGLRQAGFPVDYPQGESETG